MDVLFNSHLCQNKLFMLKIMIDDVWLKKN